MAAGPLGRADAEWLAGFLDAEGCFQIHPNNGGRSWSCSLTLALRDDDARLLVELSNETGLGTLRALAARGSSKPQIDWRIQDKFGCARLARILTQYPLRGRKGL